MSVITAMRPLRSSAVRRGEQQFCTLASRPGAKICAIAYHPCDMFRPLLNPHARLAPKIGYVLRSSPDRKEALDHDHGIWGNCSELIAEVPGAHRRKPMLCF